jgi:hypothetical protein
MDIQKLLAQKSTWASLALIVTMALPRFGVPADIVDGIRIVVVGLMGIFIRQGIQKVQDSTEDTR